MSIDVRVPHLPESVADATVVTWHKKVGDSVIKNENLVDLETDKVVLEVPAPESGILGQILTAEGALVTDNALMAIIETNQNVAPDTTKNIFYLFISKSCSISS